MCPSVIRLYGKVKEFIYAVGCMFALTTVDWKGSEETECIM